MHLFLSIRNFLIRLLKTLVQSFLFNFDFHFMQCYRTNAIINCITIGMLSGILQQTKKRSDFVVTVKKTKMILFLVFFQINANLLLIALWFWKKSLKLNSRKNFLFDNFLMLFECWSIFPPLRLSFSYF